MVKYKKISITEQSFPGLLTRNPMNGVCKRDKLTWNEIHSGE